MAITQAWAEFACTQWRRGAQGMRAGLDYAAVSPLLQAHWPRTWKRLFAGVRTIERALMAADSETLERLHGESNDHPH